MYKLRPHLEIFMKLTFLMCILAFLQVYRCTKAFGYCLYNVTLISLLRINLPLTCIIITIILFF